jgi:hypothetical protein
MFDCPIHGLTGFVSGCRHFEDAVDTRVAIPINVRVGYGEVFLLCSACTSAIDLLRGFSSDTLDSEVGMEPHSRHLACLRCAAETYGQSFQPDFASWLAAQRGRV